MVERIITVEGMSGAGLMNKVEGGKAFQSEYHVYWHPIPED